jgi:hypothetical protein
MVVEPATSFREHSAGLGMELCELFVNTLRGAGRALHSGTLGAEPVLIPGYFTLSNARASILLGRS